MLGLNWLRICRAHWVTIALATVTCLLTALMVARSLPKTYVGSARVEADNLEPDPLTGKYLSRTVLSRFSETQTAIIGDPLVTEPAALKLGYVISPPGGDTSNPAYLRSLRSSARGVSQQTDVRWDANAPFFDINFFSDSPQDAQHGAAIVREVYLDRMLEVRRKNDLERLETIREEGAKVASALDSAMKRKRDFEQANNVHLFDDNSDSISLALQALSGSPRLAQEAAARRVPRNQQAFGQIASLDAALASAQIQLGPNHPTVLALQARRAALVAQAVNPAASAGSAPQVVGTAGAITAQTARLLEDRGKLQPARLIASEVSVLSQRAIVLTGQAAVLQQAIASSHTGLKPIGDATASPKPVSPNIPVIAALALVIGFVLGVQISVVIELLNRRVRGADDLDDLDVPVLVAYNRKKVYQTDTGEPEPLVA
ncbi:hypothetical protein [Novosphingobium mangrovi (ex Huang et al. 2023)]|uniref:Polysaccharide chain length determinant N-terminal domain-containing protein n=1 Tax=Novosphingobium mangrovi (ex Huang et al. 2023) TaxID=2976432 RepID=A0ABT2I0R4_9SPHN|nr:hypothetical protein [Novosphingobium mangrovi (ex Huang et al. 2023)]MCT2398385.1 hypothetical protein [Novosphingobium mangrovi (ex Huang et al. 2023)]